MPDLEEFGHDLLSVAWFFLGDALFYNCPDVFDGIDIGTAWWPIHDSDAQALELLF